MRARHNSPKTSAIAAPDDFRGAKGMSKEEKLIKNTALIGIGNICTKGIAFLLLPVYTAILSPEEYGTVDLVLTYAALFTIILTLQLEQAVFRFLVESRENPQKQKQYISTALATVMLVLLLFLPAGYLVLSGWHYEYTGFFLAITAANVVTAVTLQLPRGLDDPVTYTMGSTLNGAMQVLLNALFVAGFRWGIAGIFAANILASALSVLFIACRLRLWRQISLVYFDRTCLRAMLKYALPVICYSVGWWVIGVSDRLVINLTIGTAYNGLYAVANKFPTLFHMVSSIFQRAWMESSFESFGAQDRNHYYGKVIASAIRFYCACNLALVAVIPFLFPVLIDPQYGDAYYYIPILTTAMMLYGICALYEAVYFAFMQTGKVARATALAAAVNVGINILLIERIGLYAAALSTLVSYGMILAIYVGEMRKTVEAAVEKGFVAGQILMYALVCGAYYTENTAFRILAALCAALSCCVTNRQLLLGCLRRACRKKNEKMEASQPQEKDAPAAMQHDYKAAAEAAQHTEIFRRSL